MVRNLNPSWIASGADVADVAGACRSAGRFAMDTEADSLHSYFHKVCLVQVTADGEHFLLDPLALTGDELAPLWEVVADPKIAVVMHGADYDIRVLDRDYAVRVSGLEDTQIMAQLLGEERTGLGNLLERDFGLTLDKRFQRADWGRRPLPAGCLDYAAADTAFVEALAVKLRQRLEEVGRWDWAVEEFAKLEHVRFSAPEPDPLAFEKIKGSRILKGQARDRIYSLFLWRESRAQKVDIPPFKIMGAAPMISVAEAPPEDIAALCKVPGLGARFARRWGAEVVRCLARPEPAPPKSNRRRDAALDSSTRQRIKSLSGARDAVAAELGLAPGLIAPKALVTAVAMADGDLEPDERLREAGLAGWRLQVLGGPFVEVVGSWD